MYEIEMKKFASKEIGDGLGRKLWLVYHDVMGGIDRHAVFTTSRLQTKMHFVSPGSIIVKFVGKP